MTDDENARDRLTALRDMIEDALALADARDQTLCGIHLSRALDCINTSLGKMS